MFKEMVFCDRCGALIERDNTRCSDQVALIIVHVQKTPPPKNLHAGSNGVHLCNKCYDDFTEWWDEVAETM